MSMCAAHAKQTTVEPGFTKLNLWGEKKINSFSASAAATRSVETCNLQPPKFPKQMHMGRANNAQNNTDNGAGWAAGGAGRGLPALSLAVWLAGGEELGPKPGLERLSSEIVIWAGFLGNSWKVPEMTFLT